MLGTIDLDDRRLSITDHRATHTILGGVDHEPGYGRRRYADVHAGNLQRGRGTKADLVIRAIYLHHAAIAGQADGVGVAGDVHVPSATGDVPGQFDSIELKWLGLSGDGQQQTSHQCSTCATIHSQSSF